MEEPSKGGYTSAASIFCGLIALYFLFPWAFAWPPAAVYGKHGVWPPWIVTCFWPVNALCRTVPAYDTLIQAEGRWTGFQ